MFYLIDKPRDISSFDVIRKLRKTLNTRKMGHTGTLDPFATGCLLIATDDSTKLIPLLENAKKEYIATIQLDGTTVSLDTETEVIPVQTESIVDRTDEAIVNFILKEKSQIPPMYSAIHVDGKRAYEKARKGESFLLEKRPISVYEASIIERSRYSLTIRMLVSSGCYMRSFAPVIADFFHIKGGYLSELRRTKIITKYGEILLQDSCTLSHLESIPYSMILPTIHTYDIGEEFYNKILNGVKIPLTELPSIQGIEEVFFVTSKEIDVVSLCKIHNGHVEPIKNRV